jgi:acyl-CoA synthetase (AMP-forming)/AMP-acid ligase II
VVAFVTAREGQTVKPDELRDFSRQQGLAQWKVPREVYVVPELPHSPTGKVLKRELAARLEQEGA